MTIRIWRIWEIEAMVVAKENGIGSKVIQRGFQGGQGTGALEKSLDRSILLESEERDIKTSEFFESKKDINLLSQKNKP